MNKYRKRLLRPLSVLHVLLMQLKDIMKNYREQVEFSTLCKEIPHFLFSTCTTYHQESGLLGGNISCFHEQKRKEQVVSFCDFVLVNYLYIVLLFIVIS